MGHSGTSGGEMRIDSKVCFGCLKLDFAIFPDGLMWKVKEREKQRFLVWTAGGIH